MTVEERLNQYYSGYDEDSRLLSRWGNVEFQTTMRYIDKYLTPGMKILEIGAATGRYSHTFAQRGYEVDAVELLDCNIDIFKKNTKEWEKVTITKGNALSLYWIENDTYDITLLLGPMYHLYTEDTQRQALKEAIRVTKPYGFIFVAYVGSDGCVIQHCFCNEQLFEQQHYRNLVEPGTFKLLSPEEEVFNLYHISDIDKLNKGLPVVRMNLVGTDMFSSYIREGLDAMSTSLYRFYLDYHFTVCERPDLVGLSDHWLDVLCKE